MHSLYLYGCKKKKKTLKEASLNKAKADESGFDENYEEFATPC